MTLYAQWAATSPVEVKFVAKGGSGSVPPLTGYEGTTITLPNDASLIRPGFTLAGWSTGVNGGGTTYKPGQTITLDSALTLYAQWTPSKVPSLYGLIGSFVGNSTTLSRSERTQIQELARSIKEDGYTKITLYGYASPADSAPQARRISDKRAEGVASYLRTSLAAIRVRGVSVRASGEGSSTTKGSNALDEVEVFVL